MHNFDHYYPSQRGVVYYTRELMSMSVFLVVKWGHRSPWSALVAAIISWECAKIKSQLQQRHLTFWVHLRWDDGSCCAAAIVILTALARRDTLLSVTLPQTTWLLSQNRTVACLADKLPRSTAITLDYSVLLVCCLTPPQPEYSSF